MKKTDVALQDLDTNSTEKELNLFQSNLDISLSNIVTLITATKGVHVQDVKTKRGRGSELNDKEVG